MSSGSTSFTPFVDLPLDPTLPSRASLHHRPPPPAPLPNLKYCTEWCPSMVMYVSLSQTVSENYSNPKTCFFHVLFKAAALAFYILSALFVNNFVIIFVITVLLAALDFWVVKNVSGRILVGLRWWNEINDEGESVWKFECLDAESLARMNKKDSWLVLVDSILD
ncbi:hypothetical protein PR202_ga22966 [Eleusine coracana subsp. coracana]|uniref:Golgi apparatus membrane protein TVP23 n=1 Tax=Eleusine coracana subsp. coracana TaxID=191504 RepID=A0AAV5D4M2_ELECO|nr:hypothetical protein PR202_ga22966 [Eleusine coracana subsp. coracana]